MFKFSDLQISPPKTWQGFESVCRDLWAEIWKFPETKKHGRSGQSQQGVDVYGRPNSGANWAGVQCKGKDGYLGSKLTETELKREVNNALGFQPPLKSFTLATTCPRDATLQRLARVITTRHITKGLFTVEVAAWEDIVESLEEHPRVLDKHYPHFAASRLSEEFFAKIPVVIKNTIHGELIPFCDQIEKGATSSRHAGSQLREEVDSVIASHKIPELLGRIESLLTASPEQDSSREIDVVVVPPDKLRTAGLIATSSMSRSIASLKTLMPEIPWDRDVRYLKRKGVVQTKNRGLTVPSRISRSILSSREFKESLHNSWLEALQPLRGHVDVAAMISLHYLRLGEHWKAAEVFVESASLGKPVSWENVYCDCLLAYKKEEMLNKFTREQRISFLFACVQYLLTCERYSQVLSVCNELRSASKRQGCVWGIVESYTGAAEAHAAMHDDRKVLRDLSRAVEVARAGDDVLALATALDCLARHVGEESLTEALQFFCEGIELRRKKQDFHGLVDSLIGSGTVSLQHEDTDRASDFFRQASETARRVGYNHGLSIAKLNQGHVAYDQDDYKAALKCYRDSRTIAEPERLQTNVVEALMAEGVTLTHLNQYQDAISAFEACYEIHREKETWDGALLALNNSGAAHLYLHQAVKGRKRLRLAYELAVEHGDDDWASQSQRNIASSYIQCEGKPGLALSHLRRAAITEEERKANSRAGRMWLDRLALLIEHGGSRDKREEAYNRALRCFQREHDWTSVVKLHECALVAYLERQEDHESGIEIIRSLVLLAEKEGDLDIRSRALAQLVSSLMELGREDEAEAPLVEAIRDGKKSKSAQLHVILGIAGEFYGLASNHSNAIRYFSQACLAATKVGDWKLGFESLRSKAIALGEAGKFDEAESAVREFCDEANRNNQPLAFARGLQLIGDFSWWRKRPKTAERQYRRALEYAIKNEVKAAEASIRLELAKALGHNGNPSEALNCLRENTGLFLHSTAEYDYHCSIAWLYGLLDKTRSERRHRKLAFEAAVKSEDPEDIASGASAMADVYEERKEYKELLKVVDIALQHETDVKERILLMQQRLLSLLQLSMEKAAEKELEAIASLAIENRLVEVLVDVHVSVGDFYADKSDFSISMFKHFLAASYYAPATSAKIVGEVQGHTLYRLSEMARASKRGSISRMESRCRRWLQSEIGKSSTGEEIDLMLTPFRIASRLSHIEQNWRQIPDDVVDAIIEECID